MQRKKTSEPAKPNNEVSRESYYSGEREGYSGEQLLALHFIQHPGTWLTVVDCEEHLKKIGRPLRRGTIYNILCTLRQREVIEGDGGMPVRYRLLQKKSESHPIGGHWHGKYGPLVVKLGLIDYLKTLKFEDVRRIHDIRLWTPIGGIDFVGRRNWQCNERQGVYRRKELVDGKYRFDIRAYEKASTLTISVACTNNPVAVDIEGLNRLYSVLCSMRAKFMNYPSVPHPGDWIVKQWHFGKDAKNTIAGMNFETTWHDFHGNLVRVYASKSVNGRVRVERIESPNKFVADLLDSAEDAKKKLVEGFTCVESMSWKTAGKMVENMEALFPTQILHV